MDQVVGKEQDWCVNNFRDFEKRLNGAANSPIHSMRRQAFDRFLQLGFPTTLHEEWRYTNVSPVVKVPHKLAEKANADGLNLETLFPFVSDASPRLVFVNGFLDEKASYLPAAKGISLGNIASADGSAVSRHLARHASYDQQPFVALNTAFLRDGAFVHIQKGAVIAEPIVLLFISSEEEAVSYPRVLVIAEESSQVTLIEAFAGAAERYISTPVTEIVALERSVVDHYRVQTESISASHISALQIEQLAGSVVRTHTFSFGGRLVRNDLNLVLNGEGTESTMNGLSVLCADQHVDNHTAIDHAKPNCFSHELYKGIYSDRSKGVFNGTITVRPDAQKTNAIQSNQSLLLSDEASVDTKPQLKIWADDVKCTHGATIGQLDDQAMFYIRSRGVGEKDARHMLIQAFASEVVTGVRPDRLRSYLEEALLAKLAIGAA